jgi:hypothetical protein
MRRMLLAVLMVLAVSVSGQELTMALVTVLEPANIQGTFTSGSQQIPANITGALTIRGIGMTSTVLADATKTLWLHLYVSSDNGQTWRYIGGGDWVGGNLNKDGTPNAPGLSVGGMEQFAGQLLRGVLDVPQRIRVGA